jgi:hypothetical protein
MIELIMYFGIGFLVAALLGLLFIPLVHNRAVRLTMKRLEASTPLSISEIRADKDQLRAESASSDQTLGSACLGEWFAARNTRDAVARFFLIGEEFRPLAAYPNSKAVTI